MSTSGESPGASLRRRRRLRRDGRERARAGADRGSRNRPDRVARFRLARACGYVCDTRRSPGTKAPPEASSHHAVVSSKQSGACTRIRRIARRGGAGSPASRSVRSRASRISPHPQRPQPGNRLADRDLWNGDRPHRRRWRSRSRETPPDSGSIGLTPATLERGLHPRPVLARSRARRGGGAIQCVPISPDSTGKSKVFAEGAAEESGLPDALGEGSQCSGSRHYCASAPLPME
jgi:hypothetical protein